MRALCVLSCVLATASWVEAQTPALSISLLAPNIAEVSWHSNYSTWQLTSTTNLTPPANWQPVSGAPFPFGDSMLVFIPITNQSGFFRL